MPPAPKTDITRRLGLALPVILGPFGGGLSTVALTAAVSNRGGLGSFGAHHLPAEEIGPIAAAIRAATDKPFALNLWISNADPGGDRLSTEDFERIFAAYAPYFKELGLEKPAPPPRYGQRFEDQIDALLEAAPPVFSFVFGVPPASVLRECKRRGIATAGGATSIAEARALDDAGVDFIVASGFEGGGHRPSFLARAEDSLMGSVALTPLIADRVKAPVIAAGGIVDGRGVRAALALGASAAQIGTAFLACDESGASPQHRALLHGAEAEHTVLTRAYSGRLARGLRNRWSDVEGPRLAPPAPYPVANWFLGKLRAAVIEAGRADLMSLWGGQAAPNVKHRKAGALMDALARDLG